MQRGSIKKPGEIKTELACQQPEFYCFPLLSLPDIFYYKKNKNEIYLNKSFYWQGFLFLTLMSTEKFENTPYLISKINECNSSNSGYKAILQNLATNSFFAFQEKER